MKKTALLSVYHKDGIIEFAQSLFDLDFELLASGGTATHLKNAGLTVKDVASLVGGGAILGHRVVTLSREVHAGLLARPIDADLQELEQLGLPFIDLVCVDLYPLKEEILRPGSTSESVIEKTDIGGPTMLRSAAKGRRIVVCDPADRFRVIDWLRDGSPQKEEFINQLAAKAEYVIAEYCLWSARYHSQNRYDGFLGERVLTCKYGENGYQTPAALYQTPEIDPLNPDYLALDKFKLVGGTDPSYNNLCDLDRLLQTMTHIAATFTRNRGDAPFIALGAKHGNLCGAGVSYLNSKGALVMMLTGDPIALFGGLVMLNFPIDSEIAAALLYGAAQEKKLLDGIIAPGFSDEAIEILSRKKGKCRLLANPHLGHLDETSLDNSDIYRYVRGGFLKQPNYTFILDLNSSDLRVYGEVSTYSDDLLLAKAICDTSNSNTITLVKNGKLIGNGVGQQSRVRAGQFSLNIAREYDHDTDEAVAASDSFFPFIDGPQVLIEGGIAAIVTSSGSVRDQEVIDLCQKHDVALLMIPDAIGRGFYNH